MCEGTLPPSQLAHGVFERYLETPKVDLDKSGEWWYNGGEHNEMELGKAGWDMTAFYIGVKIVQAWEEERDGRPGYAVKYEDGYVSWSPKDVFEKAYLPMGELPGGKLNDDRVTLKMIRLICPEYEASRLDEKTTLVKGKCVTGFTQYETSACVDPANYDEIIGSDIATEKVKNTWWKCLGFVVQWGRFGLKR